VRSVSRVEKGITKRQYSLSRWDVIVGCFVTDIVAFFIVVACGATLFLNGNHNIGDAADAAVALKPLAGQFASLLFAVGLVNAGLLSAAILSLATTYNICEGLGFESGINKHLREAPIFYSIYTLLITFGAGVVLIPHIPLIKLILRKCQSKHMVDSLRPQTGGHRPFAGFVPQGSISGRSSICSFFPWS
jgi:Mn2+/Fe2+ NRAMP family transporter